MSSFSGKTIVFSIQIAIFGINLADQLHEIVTDAANYLSRIERFNRPDLFKF